MENEKTLILKPFYVYNPTDEWYQCTIAYEEQQFQIKSIPPRSCRNYPRTFIEPTIKSFAKTTNIGNSMRSTTSFDKLIEPPLNLKTISKFRGTIDLGSKVPSIAPIVSINNETLLGWYAIEERLFMLKGKIIPKTHEIRLSILGSDGIRYKNLTGKVRMSDGKINIEASLGTLQLLLVSDDEEKIQRTEDAFISGSYMAFQNKENTQQDLYITMHGTSDGFIIAEVSDGRNKYTLTGCRNSQHAFFINISNGDISFYGDVSGTECDVSITGSWHEGHSSGSFAFFKQR